MEVSDADGASTLCPRGREAASQTYAGDKNHHDDHDDDDYDDDNGEYDDDGDDDDDDDDGEYDDYDDDGDGDCFVSCPICSFQRSENRIDL